MSSVASFVPRCPGCRMPVDIEGLVSGPQMCPRCGLRYEAVRFDPPVRRGVAVARMAEAGPGGASPCGTHPANASVASCGRCGIFMCALCRLDVEDRVLCPACFERLSAEGTLASTQAKLLSYPRLAGLSLFVGGSTCVLAAPFGLVALYFGLRERRRKREMQETDGQLVTWAVLIAAALEILAGLALLAVFVRSVATV